jgi:hypothetical protein
MLRERACARPGGTFALAGVSADTDVRDCHGCAHGAQRRVMPGACAVGGTRMWVCGIADRRPGRAALRTCVRYCGRAIGIADGCPGGWYCRQGGRPRNAGMHARSGRGMPACTRDPATECPHARSGRGMRVCGIRPRNAGMQRDPAAECRHARSGRGMRVCGIRPRNASMRACGHAGMRACGHAGMRACGHAGMRACGMHHSKHGREQAA